ncbi:hypothetical protein BaRGS_00021491 [Batillaria attramentaria]|uniref:RecA family profile 1 domain-containing protein n=1 Tax=Batillaria attramentaria TaxID=370345 RepID=A0ABD0KJS5_9CAEN
MSKQCKVESGAQLLARLGPRPPLQGLTPALFGSEPAPGDVVELYGGEGVGKTELLLHTVTTAVLPATWRNRCLHGNQAQVIWLDTDLKFSVLRLAVLLEHRILNASQSQTTDIDAGDSASSGDRSTDKVCNMYGEGRGGCCTCVGDSVQADGDNKQFSSTKAKKVDEVDRHIGNCTPDSRVSSDHSPYNHQTQSQTPTGRKRTFERMISDADRADKFDCDAHGNQDKRQCDTTSDRDERLGSKSHDLSSTSGQHSDSAGKGVNGRSNFSRNSTSTKCVAESEDCTEDQQRKVQNSASGDVHAMNKPDSACVEGDISGEEVEALVQECLERVRVVPCTSSQQMICTLHSLDATIAANRNVSLLVIDPVSAFFWSDKCRDFDHSSSYLHKTMSHVADILKKITQTYGVLIVTTKQALIKPKRREDDNGERLDPASFSATRQGGGGGHVEFLGKAWSELVTKRFICTKAASAGRKYGLLGAKGQQHFTVDENGVHICS